ncbi:MAG TPA: glycosyltransferase family 2 protein [Arachnia sp.]|nr:glycosyltransferase family 2 protein [Arachnia sp.]
MTTPPISVIMPVLDEEPYLRDAVVRVLEQGYEGEVEVLLAVGPSKDRTREIADELAAADPRVRVLDNPTGRTPAGLNIAIGAARHEIVVRVDGHGELSPGYLATVARLLESTGAANVGGLMDARGATPFQAAVAAAYNSPFGLGGGGFHLADTPAGPANTVYLGAFRRSALQELGGYDETMHRAQDWELNHRLRQAGHLVYFSPELRVTYWPRSSWKALATQFFRTGQWRREVMRRHPETRSLRYLAPPVAVSGVAAGLLAGVVGLVTGRRWLSAMLLAPAAYLAFLVVATLTMPAPSLAARLRLPLVLATMHVCWGAGFLRGVSLGERP